MVGKLVAFLRAGVWLIGIVFATLTLGSVAVVIAVWDPGHPLVNRLTWMWAKVYLVLTGARGRIIRKGTIDPTKRYVVVSNHISDLDVALNMLAARPVGVRFLAKTELFRIPFFGLTMRRLGVVEVDRSAGREAHDEINRQIAETVEIGNSLTIYAEGTRARDGVLTNFRKGAFRIAIDNRMDVIPVTIHGTYEAWPPDTPFMYGGPVVAVVHDPISVEGMDRSDITRLSNATRAVIEAELRSLGAPLPPAGESREDGS